MGKAHWTKACFKKLNMSTVTYSFLLSRVDRFKQIHWLPPKKIPIYASVMYFKGFQMLSGSKSLRGLKQFTLDINNDISRTIVSSWVGKGFYKRLYTEYTRVVKKLLKQHKWRLENKKEIIFVLPIYWRPFSHHPLKLNSTVCWWQLRVLNQIKEFNDFIAYYMIMYPLSDVGHAS